MPVRNQGEQCCYSARWDLSTEGAKEEGYRVIRGIISCQVHLTIQKLKTYSKTTNARRT